MRKRFSRQVPKKRARGVAKQKARDIIPGWPRGRSTSSAWYLSQESYNWQFPFRMRRLDNAYMDDLVRLEFRAVPRPGSGGSFSRACQDEIKFADEALDNTAYHAAQAEMVDKWHSNCRRIPGLAQLRLEFEEVGVVLEVKHRRPGALVFEVVGWVAGVAALARMKEERERPIRPTPLGSSPSE